MKQRSSRVAFVTGASRGIGKGIAVSLSRQGVSVALTYRDNRGMAEDAAGELGSGGRRAMAVHMCLEDRSSIRNAVQAVRKGLGPIDILVNNAAIAQEKPFETITDDDWDRTMAVNLRGPFTCCQEILPDMIQGGWGRIVNITSVGGQWGGFNQVHYAASKAGLINLTRSLANIYSSRGITSNAVAVGLARTDMSCSELESEAGREKVRNIPVGRVATIAEVADTALFLASEQAGYITGQTINVNGGMYFS